MPYIRAEDYTEQRKRLKYLRRFEVPTPEQAEEIKTLRELLQPLVADRAHVRFSTTASYDAFVDAVS